VGRKARGLSLFPPAWRPPYFVLSADAYANWQLGANDVLSEAAAAIVEASRDWHDHWPRGLILRSSADSETLEDRGANVSLRLAADFSAPQIEEKLQLIFSSFRDRGDVGRLAIVVQPLVGEGWMGHLSNERRVSKTVNQWHWELFSPDVNEGRLNSQRDKTPDISKPLDVSQKSLIRTFGAVGRWITQLGLGPAHIEWAHDGSILWLLQIDFERDQPDDGVDPNAWLREIDHQPTGELLPGSPFVQLNLDPEAAASPWRKIENVKRFAQIHPEAYPRLVAIAGDSVSEALNNDRSILEDNLEAFAHGRVVCRTDCKASDVSRENLPRTNTVSSKDAVKHLEKFLERMENAGAKHSDVCFLIHKFIPAKAGAWAKADPKSQIVRIDSLWGVPDGLQYLPHDTFEVDVNRKQVLSERLRYKPRFIQECADGSWQELKVRRAQGRARSLPTSDAVAISAISLEIAKQAGKPLLIMWFCGIPSGLGIGTNLPWFSMPPNPSASFLENAVSPRWPRKVLRSLEDVEAAISLDASKNVLVLEPSVSLFRDESFLLQVIRLAKRDGCPVELAGSTLAHAHYQLEKAGVSVVPADGAIRQRARGRRIFSKLVRDEIPAQIAQGGEVVVRSYLPRSEMRQALAAKLMEEAQELLDATDPDDVKMELADLLEVVHALARVTGVDWTEVEIAASEKRERRGGFDDGAVLVETELPAADRNSQRAPPVVTLRNLGKVISESHRGMVPYNALFATEKVEIVMGGRQIQIRLTKDGIILEAGDLISAPSTQLNLPFDDFE
jgi:predicted house-cleaning noncanonical NTP pyrophosphatase (MazG superfamily)